MLKRNKLDLSTTSGKIKAAVVGLVLAVTLVIGIREPNVDVRQETFRIQGLYGIEVAFSEVEAITLLEQSMAEIGSGRRTNGISIPGLSARGHFAAGRLFVAPQSAPTIRIELLDGTPIYISYRDSERTRDVYGELVSRWQN